MVGQHGAAAVPGQLLQQLFDEPEQVVDLFELAARVLVELALARQDMQLFEKLDRLTGTDVCSQRVSGGGRSPLARSTRGRTHAAAVPGLPTVAPTPKASQPA